MKTSQKIKQIESRTDRTHYEGKFNDFQSFGSSFKGTTYSTFEKDPYTEAQNFLYKRALFGLKMYKPEEIKAMHWQKRKRIKKVHRRTQDVLNLWKQEIMIEKTNRWFSALFPQSIITEELIEYSEVDPLFVNNLSFTALDINKEDIVQKLCDKKILPHDFVEHAG